jgi:hypothetical protein
VKEDEEEMYCWCTQARREGDLLLVYSSVRGGGGDVQYCWFTQAGRGGDLLLVYSRWGEEICCLCTQVGRAGDANVIW